MTDTPPPGTDAEPIDAEFEPASGPAPGTVRSGPGWGAALVLAVLAAAGGGAIGYGATQMLADRSNDQLVDVTADAFIGVRAENETAREALKSELSEEIAALERRLDTAEAAIANTPGRAAQADLTDDFASREALAALRRRVLALETTTPAGSTGASPDGLAQSVAALVARLDTLEARDPGAAMIDDLAVLRSEMDGFSDRLTNLEVELREGARAASSRQAARTEAALALSTIEAAARRGQGFSAAFANLQSVRPDDASLAALEPIALDGAPTLGALKARFGPMEDAVRAAARPEASGDALSVAERFFGDAIDVRREGEPAVAGALDAARVALDEDDLGGAISALETLDRDALTAANTWLDAARARRTLERTLDGLRLALMREDQ